MAGEEVKGDGGGGTERKKVMDVVQRNVGNFIPGALYHS